VSATAFFSSRGTPRASARNCPAEAQPRGSPASHALPNHSSAFFAFFGSSCPCSWNQATFAHAWPEPAAQPLCQARSARRSFFSIPSPCQ
jgi:hypothetical protein